MASTLHEMATYALDDVGADEALVRIVDHLRHLYAGASDGHLVLSWKSGAQLNTSSFAIDQMEGAAQLILAKRQYADVYLQTALHSEPVMGRGRENGVRWLNFLTLDFDGAWGKHKKCDRLATDPADLHRVIEAAGYPMYTRALSTGGGLLAIWALEEPLRLECEEDRKRAKDFSKNFQRGLRDAAKELGIDVDSTADLVRLTRIPETLNHKTNPARVVRLWEETGKRLGRAELERLGAGREEVAGVGSPKPTWSGARDLDRNGGDGADVEVIKEGCAFIRHAFENAETLSEPEWKAAIDVVVHCKDGLQKVHEMSAPYPHYDQDETDRKAEASLKVGPRTCANIKDELSFEGCRRCPFATNCVSPISLGRAAPALVHLAERYAYVANQDRFLDLSAGDKLTQRSLNGLFAHMFGRKSSPANELVRWSKTLKVIGTIYEPGKDQLVVDERLNLWRPGGVEASMGPWTTIGALLDTLFPEESDRDHFLNILAWVVQNPGQKIKHMPIIRGRQGTGKSTLERIVAGLVGGRNCHVANGHDLTNRFWSSLVNVQVLFIEEASLQDRGEVANRLKELVTARTIQVEDKGIAFYGARTPDLIVGFSNMDVPFPLEQGDRRAWVPPFVETKREPEFYEALYEALPGELPAFKAFLKERSLEPFRPDAPPPMTEAKLEMIQGSMPELQQHIQALIDEKAPPFDRDLVLPEEVVRHLRHRGQPTVNEVRVRKALKQLGACSVLRQLPKPRPGDRWSGELRLWAVRRQTYWKDAPATELREHFASGQSPILALVHDHGGRGRDAA